ncbi:MULTISPECIES: hypothetical protein [Burkholderia]|uniref:Uncharacterized protein n=1 Tax=Burkholderia savannae TaxID=1637837 RepID=A0ABR5TIY7_9BURK|nr:MULTISPECIES: hypothetical protein [Burkholderia]AOJ70952.1 hypothetical protein WS78_16270 [Burkholderia savannae]KVG42830.1 hypothetical protein WS77_14100 [Burkholderia sp. MSMB0265]KVG78481.1 hypothetical protein WS81_15870 [Burkholderia sp. MSMB2040]KVG90935.1 hypothetical protein WS82_16215 [Burkholderia sp. MSMB2041]KVG91662.1 hypothetical protein WS83_13200 [Burkholderia sp. MSMB2042]
MLRWLISILFLANMLAFVVVRGVFGPMPAAGPREPGHALLQVRPDALRVAPVSQAADQPIIGGPIVSPPLDTAPLNALGPTSGPMSVPASGAATSSATQAPALPPAAATATATAAAPPARAPAQPQPNASAAH